MLFHALTLLFSSTGVRIPGRHTGAARWPISAPATPPSPFVSKVNNHLESAFPVIVVQVC